jgi:hypothetical protein
MLFWISNDVFAKYAEVKLECVMGLIKLSDFALSSKNFTPIYFRLSDVRNAFLVIKFNTYETCIKIFNVTMISCLNH